jgi:hypothetical protein
MATVNGNFRILKWRYVSTIFLAIFPGDIPLHRPYIPEMASDMIKKIYFRIKQRILQQVLIARRFL